MSNIREKGFIWQAYNNMISLKCQVEALLDVKRSDCLVVNAFADQCNTIEHLSLGEDRTIHRVTLLKGREDTFSRLHVEEVRLKRINDGTTWVEANSCAACAFFSRLPFANIVGISISGRKSVQFRILAPSRSDFSLMKSRMRDEQIEFNVLSVTTGGRKELTCRQRAIMQTAIQLRYFENRNRISLTDLAEVIGVSPSTLSEIIRRSVKKTISYYFDHRP